MEPTAEGRGVMWTQQEHDRAVGLWRAGVSVTRIAYVMGRTRGSVAGHLWRTGVLGRMSTPSDNRPLRVKITQADKFMALINSTPGVVSDRIFQAAGIKWPSNVRTHYALPVIRVPGLGYRRAA